jgi:ribosomal protein S18 acetylase RimI-like enzyme
MVEIIAGQCFVAEDRDIVIGYASYEPRGLLGQPLLTYLCIKPEFRRQKIATSLVKKIQEIAKGRKLISSTEEWCIGTQKIFESLGWRRIGQISEINKDGSNEIFYAATLDA